MILTPGQKKGLCKVLMSHKAEKRLHMRCSIIWNLYVEGLPVEDVAAMLGITTKTVRKWQGRFYNNTHTVKDLHDLPRPGPMPRYDVETRCEIIAVACGEPWHYGIEGRTYWTYDLLKEVVEEQGITKMSRTSIFRTCTELDVQPQKMRNWMHSKDPRFKEKTNAIVDIYINPPEDAVVLSIDEKTAMQANERIHETKRPGLGEHGKYEHSYKRHGTQTLFAAFNIKDGQVLAWCNKTRKTPDILEFMDMVAEDYRDAKKIIIIWDNLNTHLEGPEDRWTGFNKKHGNKFEFIYTPLHASWLNQVEIFFSILYKRCLRYNSFTSVSDLVNKVMAFIRRWNRKDGHPFNWTFRGYPIQSKKKEVA